jgi:N-acetylmuramoyl-L-alanine amidase
MKTLFIDAGHSPNQVGAHAKIDGQTYKEEVLTMDLRDRILKELSSINDRQFKVVHDKDADTLVKTIAFTKSQLQVGDWLCSIHFNASNNSKAKGVEAFVPKDATPESKAFAQEAVALLATEMQIVSRGVKLEDQGAHSRLGILHCTTHSVLLEICFISNPQDMLAYQQKKESIARKLATLFKDHIL